MTTRLTTACTPKWRRLAAATLFAATLSACGGGGGSGSPAPAPPPSGALPPSSSLAQQCAPTNLLAQQANRTASLDTEKRWVRSYMDEAYLWYREVPPIDSALAQYSNTADVTASLGAYFDALLTTARTPSGKLKDEFSFTYPTVEWNALSQGGTTAGYGIEWYLGSPTPPRELRIAYVDPGTPAANATLMRGLRVVSINGVDIVPTRRPASPRSTKARSHRVPARPTASYSATPSMRRARFHSLQAP